MLILDRFEGEIALIEYTDENGNIVIIKVERNTVSAEVKEGDVLICENGIYSADAEATRIRRERLINRLRRHRKKNR